jgi:hypothetical protein
MVEKAEMALKEERFEHAEAMFEQARQYRECDFSSLLSFRIKSGLEKCTPSEDIAGKL